MSARAKRGARPSCDHARAHAARVRTRAARPSARHRPQGMWPRSARLKPGTGRELDWQARVVQRRSLVRPGLLVIRVGGEELEQRVHQESGSNLCDCHFGVVFGTLRGSAIFEKKSSKVPLRDPRPQ